MCTNANTLVSSTPTPSTRRSGSSPLSIFLFQQLLDHFPRSGIDIEIDEWTKWTPSIIVTSVGPDSVHGETSTWWTGLDSVQSPSVGTVVRVGHSPVDTGDLWEPLTRSRVVASLGTSTSIYIHGPHEAVCLAPRFRSI